MTGDRRALAAGVTTGVGSLPHTDPEAAAALVLRVQPVLPALPELPALHPREGMLARWLEASGDGSLDDDAHAGMHAFLAAARSQAQPPRAVKAQVAGPLTLGTALAEAGEPVDVAFRRGAELATAAAAAVTASVRAALPDAACVLFLDEPALTTWRDGASPIGREEAVDLLSGVLASVDAMTGVHVCGDGERRMAIEAGPDVVGFPLVPSVIDDGIALGRFLDGGGWVAWGSVPTDRPVGERADHWWNELVTLWCDLTRAGCDPVVLRTQAIVTPACGLAGHTEAQAERILEHCIEIGQRIREQAVATRLSVGA